VQRLTKRHPDLLKNLVGSEWVRRDRGDQVVEITGYVHPDRQRVLKVKSKKGVHRLNLDLLLSKYHRLS